MDTKYIEFKQIIVKIKQPDHNAPKAKILTRL